MYVLSLQSDESIGTAKLCIFIQNVLSDKSAKEEFLTMIPTKEQTRGKNIY